MDLIEHIGLRRHHARPAPAFEFDPHTRAFHENPHPSYRHLRDTAPITYWQGGDAWLISRYADVVAVQRDNRFSVTRPGVTLRDVNAAPVGRVKSAVDMLTPPDDCARRFPRLIAPFFTPQKIGLLQSALIDIVDRQIAGLKPRFDLVADYCEKVAIRAVAQVLAVPEKYLLIFYRFARAYGDIAAANIAGAPASHSQRTMDFDVGVALLRQIIAERRAAAVRAFLLDLVIGHEYQGDRLSDAELLWLAGFIIGAALDNTTQLTAATVYNVLLHPRACRSLARDKSLWPNAVLETLRYDYFVKLGTPRYALQDCSFEGVSLKRGARVYPLVAAAHRDAAVFRDPDRFDITRSTRHVLTFEADDRAAVGAQLALLVAQIAAARLKQALPALSMVNTPVYDHGHRTLRAMTSLPMIGLR